MVMIERLQAYCIYLTWTSQNQTGKISKNKKQIANKSQKTMKNKSQNSLKFLKFGHCNLFVI
jgi:hypothetical protein